MGLAVVMLSMLGLMLMSQVMSPRSHRLIEVGRVEGVGRSRFRLSSVRP